jgi:hypothetical protein
VGGGDSERRRVRREQKNIRSVDIYLDGVVNHEVYRDQGVDLCCVTSETL